MTWVHSTGSYLYDYDTVSGDRSGGRTVRCSTERFVYRKEGAIREFYIHTATIAFFFLNGIWRLILCRLTAQMVALEHALVSI